jgi:hypothetical protein
MAQKKVRILSWNMMNWGGPQRNQTTLADFVAAVISLWQADLAAILEVRSNSGGTLGAHLVNELNSLRMGSSWAHKESGQTGVKKEQVLYLYDTNVFTASNFFPLAADVANKTRYLDTANQPVGFPQFGQVNTSCYPYLSNPPFRGTFKEKTTNAELPVYTFHADSVMVWGITGCQRLAEIKEVRTAARGLVMGDFNITPSDVQSGNGQTAFTPLAITYGYAQQIINNDKTSLKTYQSAFNGMTFQQCLSEPYDNFFIKAGGFTVGNYDIPNVLAECVQGGDLEHEFAAYLKAKLSLQAAPVCLDIKTAFENFRHYVSDHLPIILEVTFK